MGSKHLDDKTIAMNLAKTIMIECADLAKNPQYAGKIKNAVKKAGSDQSFEDFALDNIIGIYEFMMYADRQPYPQAVEMYNRLHFLKDGEILPEHKGKRRFKDTVRAGELAAKAEREEGETAVVNEGFEQRKINGGKFVPEFFNIIADACGADSQQVKDMAERWMTLNYMFRQPNISGREHDDSAYKRAWFQTAGAFQDRIKELNAKILQKIHSDFKEELKAKKKSDTPSSLPSKRRLIGVVKAVNDTAPKPTELDLGGTVVPFNNKARKPKNMPVPKPDPKVIREKLIKPNSYGVMRSKMRSEMSRMGDAYEIAKQAQAEEKIAKNPNQKTFGNTGTILDNMVGLDNIKEEVAMLRSFLLREEINKKFFPDKHQDNERSYHMIFYGNPGTGKTTVAEELGTLFKDLGRVKSGHVIKAKRQDLCGEHIGKTATKTQSVIDRAIDGILFVDEAYTLYSISENDYGQEALDTIMTAMEEERDRLIVILAGYPDEMKKLMGMNPGLQSRINTYMTFEDYTNMELGDILDIMMGERHIEFADDSLKEELVSGFEAARQKLGRNFGNGRFVRNVVEKMEKYQAHRLNESDLISEELLQLDANDPEVAAKLQEQFFSITREDSSSALKSVMEAAMDSLEEETKQTIGFQIHRNEPEVGIG